MTKDKPVKILVVDDDQVHRFMLVSMLKEWGWDCAQADDGITAVAAVENHNYDAVLMDVRMAKMDGMEAFTRIQAIQPALPVIIMTAYSTVDDAVGLFSKGRTIILQNPLILRGCVSH